LSIITEKLRIIEALVRTPSYGVVGYTHNKLVYSSTSEGATDLWSLDLDAGKTKRLTIGGIHSAASVRQKSPFVVYTYDVSKGRELEQVFINEVEGGKETRLEGMKPRRILGLGFDGETIALAATTEKIMELWLLRPDGEAERIHEVGAMLFVTDYNDGKIVGQGILRGDPRAYEIFIYDLKRSEFQIYTPKEGSVNKNPKVRGDLILFTTTAFGDEKLVVYNLAERRLDRPQFTHRDHERYNFTGYVSFDWTPDGKIWFIGKREGRTKVFVDGKEIPMPEGFSSNLTIANDRVYVTHLSLTSPAKIYEVSPDATEKQVILGAQLPDEITSRFGRIRFIRYESSDGLEIPAYVIESQDAQRPGPTVVYVHGGPWSEVADSWSPLIASLVVSGYHVVAPNFRGSTGYGEEFRKLDIGDPGGGDLLDVVNAARWARENGLASKVAVTGYSYGGYMTFLATVKAPEVWDAGVAGAGIVDWDVMYELSDAFFRQFIDVLFDKRRELWKDRSPTYFAENLKVPLCIVHPQNDSRTPLKPVLRYVMKLLELKRTFELHVVPDIGHAIRRIDDILKIIMPTIVFLDRYLTEKST
jgi:dienelactone hydrolase